MGVLFRSELVKFASKDEMRDSRNSIIRQFLAGKSRGPIGMDEMASDVDIEGEDWDGDEELPARTDDTDATEVMTV
jgi:hypothetical protein